MPASTYVQVLPSSMPFADGVEVRNAVNVIPSCADAGAPIVGQIWPRGKP